jgi:hypothetical protein
VLPWLQQMLDCAHGQLHCPLAQILAHTSGLAAATARNSARWVCDCSYCHQGLCDKAWWTTCQAWLPTNQPTPFRCYHPLSHGPPAHLPLATIVLLNQGLLAFRPISYTPWPVPTDYEGERLRIPVGPIRERKPR